jgi:hypothetical protein
MSTESEYKGLHRTMDRRCFEKAQAAGEMTFTLREQDRSAPLTILRWIELNFETCPKDKLLDAFHDALNMRDSPRPKKNAD